MSRKLGALADTLPSYEGKNGVKTHYWCDVSSFAGLFRFNGAAPPPSRKFTDTPELPPRLVLLSVPSKYGSRLTSVAFNVPLASIPGTTTPTFGSVSVKVFCQLESRDGSKSGW